MSEASDFILFRTPPFFMPVSPAGPPSRRTDHTMKRGGGVFPQSSLSEGNLAEKANHKIVKSRGDTAKAMRVSLCSDFQIFESHQNWIFINQHYFSGGFPGSNNVATDCRTNLVPPPRSSHSTRFRPATSRLASTFHFFSRSVFSGGEKMTRKSIP